jgi:hypothetical protein
VLKGP